MDPGEKYAIEKPSSHDCPVRFLSGCTISDAFAQNGDNKPFTDLPTAMPLNRLSVWHRCVERGQEGQRYRHVGSGMQDQV
jgi:hypothetical protein